MPPHRASPDVPASSSQLSQQHLQLQRRGLNEPVAPEQPPAGAAGASNAAPGGGAGDERVEASRGKRRGKVRRWMLVLGSASILASLATVLVKEWDVLSHRPSFPPSSTEGGSGLSMGRLIRMPLALGAGRGATPQRSATWRPSASPDGPHRDAAAAGGKTPKLEQAVRSARNRTAKEAVRSDSSAARAPAVAVETPAPASLPLAEAAMARPLGRGRSLAAEQAGTVGPGIEVQSPAATAAGLASAPGPGVDIPMTLVGERGEERQLAASGASPWDIGHGEQFMWFCTHSGFGNQVIQLMWALRVAALLNRTLVLPPKLGHFSPIPSLGRCGINPTGPDKIRHLAWAHYVDRMSEPDFVSIGDVLDMAALPSRLVRTIDLRHFVAKWCGCDAAASCRTPVCRQLARRDWSPEEQAGCLELCKEKVGGGWPAASRKWEDAGRLYRAAFTCSNTIWTLGNYSSLAELVDAVGAGETNVLPFVHINAARGKPRPVHRNVVETLGPGSLAGGAQILAFGSMFHPRIADFRNTPPGVLTPQIEELKKATAVLPFTPEILALGCDFVKTSLGGDFACMHLRAGDGYFEKKLRANLEKAEEELRLLREKIVKRGGDGRRDTTLFLMTDLRRESWKAALMRRLHRLGFAVRDSTEIKDQIADAGTRTLAREFGLHANRTPRDVTGRLTEEGPGLNGTGPILEDVHLFVDQVICSRARLGFVSTTRSTASGHVHNLRQRQLCG